MASSTIFKNFAIPIEKKSLLLIGKDIISDKYKTEVEEIRYLIAQGNKEAANEKKKQLLAFTPSAVFTEKRQIPFLEMYSGFVHLDFDKLTPEQLHSAKQKISEIPYTHLCFISPSGNGLKVFVEVDTGLELHDIAYQQVQKHYEDATGLKADPSCKDVTRLCFMSHDPNAYRTIGNEKFIVDVANKPIKETFTPIKVSDVFKQSEPIDLSQDFIFNQQIQFTNNKTQYTDGNRNNYIYTLASNCNRAGLTMQDVTTLITNGFDLSHKEIQETVKSAYLNHRHEYKKFEAKNILSVEDASEQQMETLPDDIFETIPDFLKKITKVANTKEERDILLLGSLATLSVATPTLIGKYGDNRINANLFLFITAKASAGKGVLIHCRKLIEPIHQDIRQQAKAMKQQYEQDMADYNSAKKSNTTVEKPNSPPQKMLFIPANNSSTGFFELFNDSEGSGILFETEADTLSKSFKSEHGNFSDGLRNAFQHEPISYYRRTDKEYVEIERPKLSILLSGTPKQIQTLIPSAENGLFSRFLFYTMNMKIVWKDVFASNTEHGLDIHFEELGKQYHKLYKNLLAHPEMQFHLTDSQQTQFNEYFNNIQNHYYAIQEEEIIGTVRRLGLSAYRMMMIFSVLRIMEDGELSQNIVCNENDFSNTLKIITVLAKHSNHIYTQIAQEKLVIKPKNRKQQFLEALPYNFNRQKYVAIAATLNIPDKTAQAYIKAFKDAGIITPDSHDNYIYPLAANPKAPLK